MKHFQFKWFPIHCTEMYLLSHSIYFKQNHLGKNTNFFFLAHN